MPNKKTLRFTKTTQQFCKKKIKNVGMEDFLIIIRQFAARYPSYNKLVKTHILI